MCCEISEINISQFFLLNFFISSSSSSSSSFPSPSPPAHRYGCWCPSHLITLNVSHCALHALALGGLTRLRVRGESDEGVMSDGWVEKTSPSAGSHASACVEGVMREWWVGDVSGGWGREGGSDECDVWCVNGEWDRDAWVMGERVDLWENE